MFLKKNIKKVRSLFNGLAVVGLAATALIWGANTATINAQAKSEATEKTGATNAPSGGPLNKFLDFYQGGTGVFASAGKTDFATVAFAATGTGGPISWRVLGNPANPAANAAFIRRFDYGLADTDNILFGDFTGDSKSELAVFRTTAASAPGIFYISQFPTGTNGVTLDRAVQFGDGFSDVATSGDYDGDGKADYAVVRVLTDTQTQIAKLYWYILSSSTNTVRVVQHGQFTGATGPAVFGGADFNGDGRDELIYITRNSAGTVVNYFIGDSITGAGVITRSYGNYNTDYSFTPADYTGDGRADLVVNRQTAADGIAIWYVLNLATNTVTATRFGIADPAFVDGDIPVRGDYDGDNRHDIAVWRPSNQTFYYISSVFNNIQAQQFGASTDTPLGAFGLY